jgi:hypothetical protein
MEDRQQTSSELKMLTAITPVPKLKQVPINLKIGVTIKKLRGSFFLVIGYLLSPLSWWNDLFFNLPVAYGFGYLCSFISANLFLPCAIAGYWLSNLAGILLMQVGILDVLPLAAKERNLKKELLMGLASATVYTLVILALLQLKILDTPAVSL